MVSEPLKAILNCLKAAREEAAASFERTFGISVKIGTIGEMDEVTGGVEEVRAQAAGRCLVLEWRFREDTVFAVVPDRGVIPLWADNPDATGQAKLATLAQELGILLFPPDWPLLESAARMTPDGLRDIGPWNEPGQLCVRIPVELAGQQSILAILAGTKSTALKADTTGGAAAPMDVPSAGPTVTPGLTGPGGRSEFPSRAPSRLVPLLTRSLLKIKLSVEVILARTRKPLSEILQLGPGTIIQFDKLCDEPLELAVNGYVIAKGEAVKVGDKFGLRILEMVLPPERYIVLSGKAGSRTHPVESGSSKN